MESGTVLQQFKELAEKLGITVTERVLKKRPILVQSGFCTVKGEMRFIIDRKLSDSDKINFFVENFAGILMEDIFIAPYLREKIEKYRKKHDIIPKPLEEPEEDSDA